MQELEKWIAAHTIKIAAFDEPAFIIRPDDLRALLAGKVLCNAEPVAWLCRAIGGHVDATAKPTVRDDYRRFKRTITNLYAPADIGKEGGE